MAGNKNQRLSNEAEITLGLLGIIIADHPERIRKLLREFGLDTSYQPTGRELTNKVIHAIATRERSFHLALAKILSERLPNEEEYDAYDEEEDSYVDLIMGAIGGIGNAISKVNVKGKKQKKAEASQKMMSSMMAYKAQQQQLAAQKIAQAQAHINKMRWLKQIGIFGGVGLLGFIAYKQVNKQKQPQLQTDTI